MGRILLATFFYLACGHINAGVVYTNLNPVKVLSQNNGTSTSPANYLKIDLDNNGTTDYYFRIDFYSSNDYYAHICSDVIGSGFPYPRNQITAVSSGLAKSVSTGTLINAAQTWTQADITSLLGESGRDNLINQGDVIIGLKFLIGGSTYYYGWIRVNVSMQAGTNISITVKDYAYESTAGTAIAAGSTGTLPLSLESLTASRKEGNILLKWRISNATNVDHFIVERSTDAKNFTAVSAVMYSGGEDYSCLVTNNTNGISYFRLKMVDKDGTHSYSKIADVASSEQIKLIVFPNPAVSTVSVTCYANDKDNYEWQICTIGGKVLYRGKEILNPGFNKMEMDIGNYPSGMYVLKVFNRNSFSAISLVKQ